LSAISLSQDKIVKTGTNIHECFLNAKGDFCLGLSKSLSPQTAIGCAEERSASVEGVAALNFADPGGQPGLLEVLRCYPTKTSTPFRKRKTLVLPSTEQPKEEGATKKPPPAHKGSSVVSLLWPSRQ
jgi:hypothetical protein